MNELLTSKVILDDGIKYYKPSTNEWKILNYLHTNNGKWVSLLDICNATRCKSPMSVSRYISMLGEEHDIEKSKHDRVTWYRYVGKMKVNSDWYEMLRIIECKDGLWVSSCRVAEMLNLNKIYVGCVLSMFVNTLGLEKKLEARLTYYRYI